MIICCAHDCTHNLSNNVKGGNLKNRVKHHVAGSIHSDMGNTLDSIATSISLHDQNNLPREKGQQLEIISRKNCHEIQHFLDINK